MLSYLQMHDQELTDHRLVSMMGVKPQTVIDTMERYGISPKNVYLCSDNDKAGNEFAERLMSEYPDMKRIVTPDTYKDWNDMLRGNEKEVQKVAEKKRQRSDMLWYNMTSAENMLKISVDRGMLDKLMDEFEKCELYFAAFTKGDKATFVFDKNSVYSKEIVKLISGSDKFESVKKNRSDSHIVNNGYNGNTNQNAITLRSDIAFSVMRHAKNQNIKFSAYTNDKNNVNIVFDKKNTEIFHSICVDVTSARGRLPAHMEELRKEAEKSQQDRLEAVSNEIRNIKNDIAQKISGMNAAQISDFVKNSVGRLSKLEKEQARLKKELEAKPIRQSDIEKLRSIEPKRKSVQNLLDTETAQVPKFEKQQADKMGEKSAFEMRKSDNSWRNDENRTVPIISVGEYSIPDKIQLLRKDSNIERGTFVNEDTGVSITFGRNCLDEIVSKTIEDDKHKMSVQARVCSLYHIQEIIENAVCFDSTISEYDENTSKNKSPNTLFMHRMYGAINYRGDLYLVNLAVEEMYQTDKDNNFLGTNNRLYSLRDIKITPTEELGGQTHFSLSNDKSTSSLGVNISIAQLYDLVKTYDQNFYENSAALGRAERLQELETDKTVQAVIAEYSSEHSTVEKDVTLSPLDTKSETQDTDPKNKIPTEEEKQFMQADLARFLAEYSLSSDEWESMAYPLFENGYLDKHQPSDRSLFGYHLPETELFALAERYHQGEDIRRELALGLTIRASDNIVDKDKIEFIFEDGKISDRTYHYAKDLRHSLHLERTDDGYNCSFSGIERFVSLEEIGQAFLDRIHEEFEDLTYWAVLDFIKDDIPDIDDDTVKDLITAFDNATMADWEKGDNLPKINRIKKALYDVLGDEEQTEKAFACIAKYKYNVTFDKSEPEQQNSKFQIYQLPDGEEYHGIRFEGMEQLKKDGIQLNKDNYELVYEGEIAEFQGNAALEKLYTQFNTDRPDDFTGRSLSVSDVIVISDNGTETAYFCDSFGFTEMPEFFRDKELVEEKNEASKVSDFKAKTNEMFNNIGGYSPKEIEALVEEHIINIFAENEISAEVKDLAVYGSRSRGMETDNSDLDIVVEIANSDLKEDFLFNILNEDKLEIDGIKIDINPIRAEETGTLEMYLENAEKYLSEKSQENKTEKAENKTASEYVTLLKVGDFYEMYGKDAEIGAEVLGLHMFSRKGESMVGFPDRMVYEYSEKLKESGYTVIIDQALGITTPKSEVEKSIETPLDKAKQIINDFCEAEYREGADFSDLHNVSLAFTTLTDDELPVQVTADLIDFKITYEFDGEVYNIEQYDSIEDMIDNGLTGLDFSDLVSVPDEVIDRHIGKDEQIAAPASDIDDDTPLFSDESLLDLEKSENSGSFDDNVKGEQLSFFGEPVEQKKSEKPKSEFASGPIVDGVQVYQALAAEIDHGTDFEHGKFRVQDFFDKNNPTTHQLADFLKKEYGTGGHSGDGNISLVDYNSQGMTFSFKNGEKYRHSWNNVATMVKARLDTDTYLTAEEKAERQALAEEKGEDLPDRKSSVSVGDKFRNKLTGVVSEVVSLTGALPFYTDDCTVKRMSGEVEITENIPFSELLNADRYEHIGKAETEKEQHTDKNEQTAELIDEAELSSEIAESEARPTITCEWSESNAFEDGKTYSAAEFDSIMREADKTKVENWQHGIEKYGSEESWKEQDEDEYYSCLGYDKTKFTVNMPDGTSVTERQDIGDGYGGAVDFLRRFGYEHIADVLQEDIEKYPLENTDKEISAEEVTSDEQKQVSASNEGHDIVREVSQSIEKADENIPIDSTAKDNFTITDNSLGEGGAKAKFAANIEAIKTLKTLEAENRPATADEKETLSKYVGWGGISQAFDKDNEKWSAEYKELSELLDPQEYRQANASVLDAFYTSPAIIDGIYEALDKFGFEGGNVLEPSCGVGNFFGRMPEEMRSNSKLYGVEIDSITGRIAKQLYPSADIQIKGFEKNDFQKGCFDVAVGNVPFGDLGFTDTKHNTSKLHDYFFMETLDKVKDGGIVAFVTSTGTLDKKDEKVRKQLSEQADLIGAVRLPNNAFRANAGTDVTSDILFFQKRSEPRDLSADTPDWVHIGVSENGLSVNEYFAKNPDMILGELVRDSNPFSSGTKVIPKDGSLREQLLEAVNKLSAQISDERAAEVYPKTEVGMVIPPEDLRCFSLFEQDNNIYFKTTDRSCEFKYDRTNSQHSRAKAFIALRDCTRELISAQEQDRPDSEIKALQDKLNVLYDKFYEKYGLLHSQTNKRYFREDISYNLVATLERRFEKDKLLEKSDIFTKRTIKPAKAIESVDTAMEALTLSIAERARVDLDYMQGLTDMPKETLIAELKGEIYPVPFADGEYQTASEYLSGDIRAKLDIARSAAEKDGRFSENVEALEKAMPLPIKAGDIDVKIGATWIDPKYYEQFMYETFGTPQVNRSDYKAPFWQKPKAVTVEFSPVANAFSISNKRVDRSVAATKKYGTEKANAYEIMESLLNLREPKITMLIQDPNDPDKKKRVVDVEATKLAQKKAEKIKEAFAEWIFDKQERREEIVASYNRIFNSIRPREYDGSNLRFPNMNPEVQLREHQKDAIAHALFGGNTLFAHSVGAGKSATRS